MPGGMTSRPVRFRQHPYRSAHPKAPIRFYYWQKHCGNIQVMSHTGQGTEHHRPTVISVPGTVDGTGPEESISAEPRFQRTDPLGFKSVWKGIDEDAESKLKHIQSIRSMAIAVASPPPIQSDAMPTLAPCARIAPSNVTRMRAPDAPMG